MPSPKLMTTREAAECLEVTPRQVARLVPAKLTPAYTLPGPRGAHMFESADVEQLAKERKSA